MATTKNQLGLVNFDVPLSSVRDAISALASSAVTSVAGKTGVVTLAASDLTNGVTGTGAVVLAQNPTIGGGVTTGNVTLSSGGALAFGARTVVISEADGDLRFNNSGYTGVGSLVFGPSTASFFRIKRVATAGVFRLGDDSDYAFCQAKHQTHSAYTAGAPTATGYLTMYDSNGTAYRVLVST